MHRWAQKTTRRISTEFIYMKTHVLRPWGLLQRGGARQTIPWANDVIADWKRQRCEAKTASKLWPKPKHLACAKVTWTPDSCCEKTTLFGVENRGLLVPVLQWLSCQHPFKQMFFSWPMNSSFFWHQTCIHTLRVQLPGKAVNMVKSLYFLTLKRVIFSQPTSPGTHWVHTQHESAYGFGVLGYLNTNACHKCMWIHFTCFNLRTPSLNTNFNNVFKSKQYILWEATILIVSIKCLYDFKSNVYLIYFTIYVYKQCYR